MFTQVETEIKARTADGVQNIQVQGRTRLFTFIGGEKQYMEDKIEYLNRYSGIRILQGLRMAQAAVTERWP